MGFNKNSINKKDQNEKQNQDENQRSEAEGILRALGVLNEEMDDEKLKMEHFNELIIFVKSLPLSQLSDVKIVEDEVREGNIIILDILELRQKDERELIRAVDQLRGICRAIDGDIAQFSDQHIIITPPFIRIYREKKGK